MLARAVELGLSMRCCLARNAHVRAPPSNSASRIQFSSGVRARHSRGVTESRARARVKITMYSASWCGVCRSARAYLQHKGIHFVERDVDRDASAHRRFRALSPKGSLPTIQIDDQVMEGFDPKSFEELMTEATRTRIDQHDASGPKTFEIRWR